MTRAYIALMPLLAALGCAVLADVVAPVRVPEIAPLQPIYELPTVSLGDKAELLYQGVLEGHLNEEGYLLYAVWLPLEQNYARSHASADMPAWHGDWMGQGVGSLWRDQLSSDPLLLTSRAPPWEDVQDLPSISYATYRVAQGVPMHQIIAKVVAASTLSIVARSIQTAQSARPAAPFGSSTRAVGFATLAFAVLLLASPDASAQSSCGSVLVTWPLGSGPSGVASHAGNSVYVGQSNKIQRFDMDGNLLTEWGTMGDANGQFDDVRRIAVDANGDVYVVDSANFRVQKFDSDGNFVLKWSVSQPTPWGIDVAADLSVYVTYQFGAQVERFDSAGNSIALWGSECRINTGMGCVDPDGPGPLELGDGQFFFPHGVVVDSQGNVFVSDTNNNRIQKFDSNGNFLLKWGTTGSGVGQFTFAEGIDVDASDKVYVADFSNKRIQKFDGNGTFIEAWTTAGSDPTGPGLRALDVAVDIEGQVYVAVVQAPGAVQRFSCGCGNGVLDPGEQCDDGNSDDGDGCSSSCEIEPGFECSGEPSVCALLCGNGTLDVGEECDDGNTTSFDDCSSFCEIEGELIPTGGTWAMLGLFLGLLGLGAWRIRRGVTVRG